MGYRTMPSEEKGKVRMRFTNSGGIGIFSLASAEAPRELTPRGMLAQARPGVAGIGLPVTGERD
jgi:hypothetical protein